VDLMTAHGAFLAAGDRFPIPLVVTLPGGREEVIDGFCVLMTAAAASLSGMLDECADLDDLKEAYLHFFACYDSGIFGDDDWLAEAARVLNELIGWGQGVEVKGRG
jgi:hypothetical protein